MAFVTYTAKREIQNDTAGFVALFKDLGAGQVDTSLWRGVGPATFTRATAAACRLGSGLWKLDVAAGVPRSHYLPDLSYGGYLCEGAAAQLITPAAAVRDMTNAAWVKTSMTAAKTSVGIDGVANACTRLTATGANGTALFTLTAAASSRTYSFYVKRITGAGNIQITQNNGGAWTTVAVTAVFTLVQLNASVLNAVFGIRIVTSGDAIDVDVNQFEAGGMATTPIPPAGVRNADILSYPAAGNAADAAGTAYAEFSATFESGLSERIIGTDASSQALLAMLAVSTEIHNFDGTNAAPSNSDATMLNGLIHKAASTWAPGRLISSLSGGIGSANNNYDGSITGAHILIGNNNGTDLFLNGTIKNVRLYAAAVTDAILQQMTIFGTDYARIPGQSYSLEFKAEKVDRSEDVKRSMQQPIGGGAPEVLNYRSEVYVDVLTEILDEATQVPQVREFLASVQAGEVFTFDRYGTVAAPVDPRQAMLSSEKYAEQRVMTSLRQRIPFQVRLLT